MYQMNTHNGCIVSIARGVTQGNLTQAEYLRVREALSRRPTASEGVAFRLKTDLTWEQYALPQGWEEE